MKQHGGLIPVQHSGFKKPGKDLSRIRSSKNTCPSSDLQGGGGLQNSRSQKVECSPGAKGRERNHDFSP